MSFASGGFYGFDKLLRRYMEQMPKKPVILEWGPGYSTGVMLDIRPEAVIYTYESEANWYRLHSARFNHDPNVHMYHIPLTGDYTTRPLSLGITFDMVFIDGRDRVKCCYTARELVKATGYVLMHDANRREYREGVNLFRMIIFEGDTAVMKKK